LIFLTSKNVLLLPIFHESNVREQLCDVARNNPGSNNKVDQSLGPFQASLTSNFYGGTLKKRMCIFIKYQKDFLLLRMTLFLEARVNPLFVLDSKVKQLVLGKRRQESRSGSHLRGGAKA